MELPSKSANYLSLFSYSSPIAVPASVRLAAQKCWRCNSPIVLYSTTVTRVVWATPLIHHCIQTALTSS